MKNIPGFKVKECIGKGGMASVYIAEQESVNRTVAIKMISPSLSADPTFSERFIKEAKFAASLTHPNIIIVHDAGRVDSTDYMVMEYVDGGELSDLIEAGITLEQSIKVMNQIGKGLEFAHQNGVVHRDVKPGNILFRKDGTPLLADFGIAKAATENNTKMTAVGMTIGSPHYMSPEQSRGAKLDGRSDLYSLGVVFYEMLTGKKPYDADDTYAITVKHINDPIPVLPNEYSQFQPVLERMLAKEREQRYSSMSAMLEELNIVANGGTLQLPPTELRRAVAESATEKSGKSPVMLSAVVGVVLAVGGGLFFLNQDNDETSKQPKLSKSPVAEVKIPVTEKQVSIQPQVNSKTIINKAPKELGKVASKIIEDKPEKSKPNIVKAPAKELKANPLKSATNNKIISKKIAPVVVTAPVENIKQARALINNIKLSGKGFAATVSDAEDYALSDLAGAVLVAMNKKGNVCEGFKSTVSLGECDLAALMPTKMDVPLLGVEFTSIPGKDVGRKVTLEAKIALPLYQAELEQRNQMIEEQYKSLKSIESKPKRQDKLSDLYTDVKQYNRYGLVASLLGQNNISGISVSEGKISSQIIQNAEIANTIEEAAKIITKSLKRKDIFVYPPRSMEGSEVTPFAAAFQNELKQQIGDVSKDNLVGFSLLGQYQTLDDGKISVTYELLDKKFIKKGSSTVLLAKNAFKGMRTKPNALNFEKMLNAPLEASSEFRGEITTNLGSDTLLFREGESIRIMVRLNKPGYYYVVGYVVKPEEEYSYLLELNEGKNKFVQYVSPDQVGRYVDLGEYEIEAPFGVEYLQLVAANKNLKDKLPAYSYDEKLGYYVVDKSMGNAIDTINLVRGFKKKNKSMQMHESQLTVTTMAM